MSYVTVTIVPCLFSIHLLTFMSMLLFNVIEINDEFNVYCHFVSTFIDLGVVKRYCSSFDHSNIITKMVAI